MGMSEKVLFHIDLEKALEAVVWLANKMPGIDIYHIGKILFYADKKHLNRYGRPITGDNYVKMPYGPGPSAVLDIINLNSYSFSAGFIDAIESAIEVSNNRNKNTIALREPDTDHFSESDLECLEESLADNGSKSFSLLKEKTHDEPCYNNTADSDFIDYRLMVDDTNEYAEEIRSHILEQSEYIRF